MGKGSFQNHFIGVISHLLLHHVRYFNIQYMDAHANLRTLNWKSGRRPYTKKYFISIQKNIYKYDIIDNIMRCTYM